MAIKDINEATTLGELQVTQACLGADLRTRFRHGVYYATAYARGETADGKGSTLAQAIGDAFVKLRVKLALGMAVADRAVS